MTHQPPSDAFAAATVADWTCDPRAACILASFAQHPPKAEWRATTYAITRDEWVEYVGYRVECLNAIYNEHFKRVAPTNTMTDPDWTAFDAFMAQPRVQEAIEVVVHPPEPVAAVDLWADVFAAFRPAGMIARGMAVAA